MGLVGCGVWCAAPFSRRTWASRTWRSCFYDINMISFAFPYRARHHCEWRSMSAPESWLHSQSYRQWWTSARTSSPASDHRICSHHLRGNHTMTCPSLYWWNKKNEKSSPWSSSNITKLREEFLPGSLFRDEFFEAKPTAMYLHKRKKIKNKQGKLLGRFPHYAYNGPTA